MKILADRAIPQVGPLFSTLGEVTLTDRFTAADVRDAECLVVRSVTRVDRDLLAGARPGCIASAASGTDHIDQDYLQALGIPLFPATGCNARAVAEYVLSCLFVLSEQDRFDLEDRSVGIIGCGHVGGELQRLLHCLGLETRVYDPFLRDARGRFGYRDLEWALGADVISLHVPLTTGGEYPTSGMVAREFLGQLREDVIFINTARGGVVDEDDLIDFAGRNRASRLALDVWHGEPEVNEALFRLAALATPHVAGYSTRARLNATRRVYEQVCAWAGVAPSAPATGAILPDASLELPPPGRGRAMEAVQRATLACYDVRTDCAAFRELEAVDAGNRSDFFRSIRTGYPHRREFSDLRVVLSGNDGDLREKLSGMGFDVAG